LLWSYGLKPSKRKQRTSQPAGSTKLRIRILLGLLLVLASVFFYRGGFAGFAQTMASNALLKHDLPTAEKWIAIAQKIPGTGAEVEYLLAKKARLDKSFEEMADHLRAALKQGFDPELLQREQILANASLGEMDPMAESEIKRWIAQQGPELGDVVDAYANGLAALSRFEDATKVLEDYEQLFPGDPMVNYRFGIMNEHKRGNENAEKEYLAVLEKDPQHVQAAWRLARIQTGKNDPQAAIKILTKFDYGKQALAIKTFLGHCYQQLGNFDKSREYFKAAVEQGHDACQASYRVVEEVPERFLAASDLGVLEATLGNWEDAKRYLEMALEVNPRDFTARNSYAQALRRLGLVEESEKEFARIKEEREEFDKITVLRDRVNQNPNDTAARVETGKILFKYESERFGLFWIRSALTADPNCQEAHQFLADYYETKYAQTHNEIYRTKADEHRFHVSKTTEAITP
jgi:tetratricopeptide (TPR) repeat protein